MKKVLKSMPAAEPIIRLGGSPTKVATPPVSDNNAAASRNGIGLTLMVRQIRMISGPKITTVVTLSSNSESTVTSVPSMAIRKNSRPLLKSAIRYASAWNPPVGIMIATIVIIPASRNTTFQSMASTARVGL